jgi:hypothetical protein
LSPPVKPGDYQGIYQDSNGQIDELLHDKGKFLDYRMGHEEIDIPDLRTIIINQINAMDDGDLAQVLNYICYELGHGAGTSSSGPPPEDRVRTRRKGAGTWETPLRGLLHPPEGFFQRVQLCKQKINGEPCLPP